MDDIIRDRLIEILKVPIYPRIGADPAEVVADYLLDNEVQPVRHGHWIFDKGLFTFYCSECSMPDPSAKPYCSECGAKMDEEVQK